MADTKSKPAPPSAKTEQANKVKTPRTRSPNYPAIDLETAIERAETLFRTANRHAVGYEVVAKAWSYGTKSSSFRLAIAAVRSFGLLQLEEGGKEKLAKLTPLALDIVADYPQGHPKRIEAIKTAALTPKINNELW